MRLPTGKPCLAAAAAALALVASCSFPSQAPVWDTRWILPADRAEIDVSDFLPGGVTVAPGGRELSVAVDPFTFARSLGDVCPACGELNGQVVPKPAFQTGIEGEGDLPAEVMSVTVSELSVRLAVTNGFGFDPLRPGGGATGSLTFYLLGGADGQIPVDSVRVDGAGTAFPPGTTLERTAEVSGAEFGSTVRVMLVLDSPAGDPVRVDTGASIHVVVTPETVLVSSARVSVAGRTVSVDPVELSLADVDQDLVDRVESGALELLVRNPLRAPVDFTLRITGGFPDIVKAAALSAAENSTTRVEFTPDELHTFLGKDGVELAGSGTVPAGTPPVTVTAADTVVIRTRLDAVLRIGG